MSWYKRYWTEPTLFIYVWGYVRFNKLRFASKYSCIERHTELVYGKQSPYHMNASSGFFFSCCSTFMYLQAHRPVSFILTRGRWDWLPFIPFYRLESQKTTCSWAKDYHMVPAKAGSQHILTWRLMPDPSKSDNNPMKNFILNCTCELHCGSLVRKVTFSGFVISPAECGNWV